MMADIGPSWDKIELSQEETDAFAALVEGSTYPEQRKQLSYAFLQVRHQQGKNVIDGFQRNARKMWRTL
jgi:hypothetical protein